MFSDEEPFGNKTLSYQGSRLTVCHENPICTALRLLDGLRLHSAFHCLLQATLASPAQLLGGYLHFNGTHCSTSVSEASFLSAL